MRSRRDRLPEEALPEEEWWLGVERDIANLLVEERKETQQDTMPSTADWENPPKNVKLKAAAKRLT
jgi:hypothetical protein